MGFTLADARITDKRDAERAGERRIDGFHVSDYGRDERVNDMSASHPSSRVRSAPHASDVQTVLVELWAMILGRPADSIHADDNFFGLNGDSFSAMVLCSSIEDRLGVPLTLQALIENPTLAELSRHLVAAAEAP
jgi:acyl carrier protein